MIFLNTFTFYYGEKNGLYKRKLFTNKKYFYNRNNYILRKYKKNYLIYKKFEVKIKNYDVYSSLY